MQDAAFFVGDSPFVVWDWDIRAKNGEFVSGIDGSYYEYLAEVHAPSLETDARHHGAVAMRAAYHHGQETLFSLLCAALQAPFCVPGWIQKCGTSQLRSLVRAIGDEQCSVGNFLNLDVVTWDGLSDRVNLFAYEPAKLADTRSGFADFWGQLARDWLGIDHIDEYRAIKHGFRVQPGGFTIHLGLEKERGVAPPPEAMQNLGGSEFGSSFLVSEQLAGAPRRPNDNHFQLRRRAVNWSPESIAAALRLIAMSINNIKSFLRIYNGEQGATVTFTRPEERDAFVHPWFSGPDVSGFSIDSLVRETDVARHDENQLRELIQAKIDVSRSRWSQGESRREPSQQ